MPMAELTSSSTFFLLLLLFLHSIVSVVESTSFVLTNNCRHPVWPGILSNAGVASLSPTGFVLQQGESRTMTSPTSWAGRMWGRTRCSQDSDGIFSCLTGDCGSRNVECNGNGAAPPATLAEFTLDGYGGKDFYDVSLVDGYNLPVLVTPRGGSGQNCSATGCISDLNVACPSELAVAASDGAKVACRSACEAFNQPEYCCVGAYATPDTCKATSYSQMFKNACPRAYSYAYDDGTSTFTCSSSPDYVITFCPSPNTSLKSAEGQASQTPANEDPVFAFLNSAMVYSGAATRGVSGLICSMAVIATVGISTRMHLFG